jgi:hypothetical protein
LKTNYLSVRLIKDIAAPIIPPVIYDDWFLPSKDELQKIYDELYLFGIGAFGAASHWSSSEDGALKAWRLDFPSGTYFSTTKGDGYNITAVRTFVSAYIYALRDFGQAGYIFHIVDNGDGTFTYYEGGLAFGFPGQRWSNISALAGTNTAIGSGNANTNLIIGQAGHIDSAALLCYNYST